VLSLCFNCRNMCFWYILHVYTKIHMYDLFYMKCTVLLVFSCIFTVFSLQKHVLLVHFTCIYQNTHVPYILNGIHSFASVFICFHCVFYCRNMYFWYISHVYQNTSVQYILHKMHSFVSVFIKFSPQTHVLLVHFTCIPKYTYTIYLR
jgi:hypothetical protein